MPAQPMIRIREGRVLEIVQRSAETSEVTVELTGPGGKVEKSLAYHSLTGPVAPGDRVVLNTTAVDLELGTGGLHFISAVYGRSVDAASAGHIMKMRYTPAQVKVLAVEEEESPFHERLRDVPDLAGIPVVVGSLHSQVPLVAAAIKVRDAALKVVYVMTDGAALPAAFSRLVSSMRTSGLVDCVITAGHAFGGDLEAVTIPSALAAARVVVEADVVVVAMGPGVVGTGTPLGTTALEVAPIWDGAAALNATPVAAVRASWADERERHRGISHHTLTALNRFVHVPVHVPLPRGVAEWTRRLELQAEEIALAGHPICWEEGTEAYAQAKVALTETGIEVRSMGRSDRDDPLFFQTAAVAGMHAVRLIRSPEELL